VAEAHNALRNPKWPVFLGRKSCTPGAPVLAAPLHGEEWTNPGMYDSLSTALVAVPWHPRSGPRSKSTCDLVSLQEWRAKSSEPEAPPDAEVWHDVPVSFDPPVHRPRFVVRSTLTVLAGGALLSSIPAPPRSRADYRNIEYRKARAARLDADEGLCVFCKSPATTVQHVTYRRAGGDEAQEDLRALCRLCHDAVTMLEYGAGMGLDRIDPVDPRWREAILRKRDEIVRFRSLATRRRHLTSEDVE
jgi:hypothetical protein